MPKGWVVAVGVFLSGCGVIEGRQDEKQAKEAVVEQLLDPESARFQNLEVATVSTPQGSRIRSVCGEVNAKNRVGGYVGFRRFVYVVERKFSPETAREDGMKNWTEGKLLVANPEWYGTLEDMTRICRNGAVLTEDDVNLSTPTF